MFKETRQTDRHIMVPDLATVTQHLLVDGHDLDVARAAVTELFVDHRLSCPTASARRPVTVSTRHFDALSLCFFDYGREIQIMPDELSDFYLMIVPLTGGMQLQAGNEHLTCGTGGAILLPPDRKIVMQWSEAATQVIVRIDKAKLRRGLDAYFGQSLVAAPNFQVAVNWSSDSMAPLRHAMALLASTARLGSRQPGIKLIEQGAEHAFVHALLSLHPSDLSAAIATGKLSSACPRNVRRAEEFIEANLAQPISIDDLVAVSDASSRALFEGFNRFRGMSPLRFVRCRRLQRVREALSEADEMTSVISVAMSWGFQHMGRFAAEYARQFGEPPFETLKRARNLRH
jgi:AraC-like DNA-binding protein